MIDKFNLFFLKFDKTWFQISTVDGSVFSILPNGVSSIEDWFDERGMKFSYPITALKNAQPKIVDFFGLKLIFIKVILSKYSQEECGIKLVFEHYKTIVIQTDTNYNTHLNYKNIIPEMC